jgi:hypothetical protein
VPAKWNVVSPRVNEGRVWWVSTNTGVRNGGSPPHQPRQPWSCQGLGRHTAHCRGRLSALTTVPRASTGEISRFKAYGKQATMLTRT